jgi:hypothetical protein
MITIVKTIHTAAFALLSVANLLIFWGALTGQVSRATKISLVLVGLESVVLYANSWRCPLTSLAERLGSDHGQVTDIFLPKCFADRIFSTCGGLLGVSVGLFALRFAWREAAGAGEGQGSNGRVGVGRLGD